MAFAGGQPGGTGRGERGAAAVEFAIVLPLLFVMLFGIVEFSIIMYDKALITSASREGARFGAVFQDDPRPTCDEINTGAVQAYMNGLIDFNATKTIDHKCYMGNPPVEQTNHTVALCTGLGEILTVRTIFTYHYLVIPNFVVGLMGPLTLVSETVMRCE